MLRLTFPCRRFSHTELFGRFVYKQKQLFFLPWREARIVATSLKAGQSIFLKGKLFSILKATHHQGTARQIGNVQLELRDVRTHLKHIERLRSSADVEIAFFTSQTWNILYREKEEVVLMHPESYEQVPSD